ncbi:TIGR01777 family oxidoreductase [Flagellimonas lutaonensis]|uniref:NAD(P)-dependent epimerase/dehydratase n=1 Tax=Flagellimonas lutaonensis TaxID=516051 RepID=A0A0D5YQH1_9FLAO|nr:TIGR01777 family oxidoreductase [Allomuricauda lutaonensis]AKA34169.1 NAD(P)-dependent epimerase/dehydratase [Allomuricauda lutaonensis]
MKVLLTGATGLVGTALVDLLLAEGHTVHYLTTRKQKIENKEKRKGFYWDPANGELDMAALEGVSAIINLAGASISQRWTAKNKKKILNSRLQSLETLYNALERSQNTNIKMLVTASAIGIYPSSASKFYDENEKGVDDSFLGQVVKAWESKADTFTKLNLKVAKIRIGLVLSTKGGALPSLVRPIKYYVGAPLGSGNQWQSWIHIDDLAQLFVFVIKKGLAGVFNGVAPNPVTNAKLTKEAGKVLERPLWLPNVPKWVLRLVLGEMSYVVLASQRVSSKKIEERGFVFEYANVGGALQNLLNKPSSR